MMVGAISCFAGAAACLGIAWWWRWRSAMQCSCLTALDKEHWHGRLAAARQERLRFENELDLLRSVFEVSSELIDCVDEQSFRQRVAAALTRYWHGDALELFVWEQGVWRGGSGSPPQLAGPVTLPGERDHNDMILDLSAGVEGQAALVLRHAQPQPILAGWGADDQRKVAELLRGQFALSLRRITLYQRLQSLARSDALTGACRRWYGEARLAELVDGGAVVAVCIVDIDHFKRINDTYGHAAGDRVLATVGRALLAAVRGDDLVVRLGGEEFLVILPGALPAGAYAVAKRLRVAIAELRDVPCPVTVSVGCACCHRDDTAEALIARADAALYQAKHQGRNCVVLADAFDSALVRSQPVVRKASANTQPVQPVSYQAPANPARE